MQPVQMFIDSLTVRFEHMKAYELNGSWAISTMKLRHNVLWYVEEGELAVQVGERTCKGQSGQAILLPAGSEISSWAITGSIRLLSVNFRAEIPLLGSRSWNELLRLPVVFPDTGRLGPLFLELLEQSGHSGPTRGLLWQAGLLRILAELLGDNPGAHPDGQAADGGSDDRILLIIDYLVCHPALMPGVRELAELVGLSESHLRRLFLRDTAMAPVAFVRRLKIEQAKKLLIESELRIGEVALSVGFADPNHFSRVFRSFADATPMQYRRQFRLWTPESGTGAAFASGGEER